MVLPNATKCRSQTRAAPFSYVSLLSLAVSYRQPTRVLYFYSLSLPAYSLAVQRTSSLGKGELQVTPSDLSGPLKKAKATLILFPYH